VSRQLKINPTQPVKLIPVNIAKPWGQEIWFTAIEDRGESQVLIDGIPVPLSDYLNGNRHLLTQNTDVLLLKVLDPKPHAIHGDLYFEVHEQKQEVYVVTHIDRTAWPEGVGAIRLGMRQEKRRHYPDDKIFRAAYLKSVNRYEDIRQRIDVHGEHVAPEVEREAREAMNDFSAIRSLRVGDVIQVPTWTPHSLLHGVRVVEFQTPTYERFIISFAQKVTTQSHWDSHHAVANMHIDAPKKESFEPITRGVERVAKFDDFNVWRVDLDKAKTISLPSHLAYAVCMALADDICVGNLKLNAEQACFLPHQSMPTNQLTGSGQILIAAPNL